EMGIENDLGHGKHAAGLQGIENLSQRRLPIRNFAQDRHQHRSVEPVGVEFALSQPALEKSNIGEVCGLRFFPGALEHPGLDIHGHDFASRADLPGDRDGNPTRTTAGIQHGHARLQIQTLNDDRRAIGFREGTVQLHQPTQPYRTGDRMAAGTDEPYNSDDADDADQGEKDVGDDHGSQTQARSTAKRLRSASEQWSRAPSCVARNTTRGAWPASRASCQRGAQRHQRSPGLRPRKPNSGTGAERPLPRDLETSRNPAVMTAQTVWLPMSSRPVSQQPSRNNPVMGFIEPTSSRSPSTLRGVSGRPPPCPLSSLSMTLSARVSLLRDTPETGIRPHPQACYIW